MGEDVGKHLTAWMWASFSLTFAALPGFAADDPALGKNLTSVLASQGLACGKVTKIRTQADGDYLVACQDGSSYQIVADAQGKLIAHPLGMKIH
jgi:hypothetical protein